MQRVYLVFDYFKEAFHINRNNKSIYLPQISFIIIKALIILTIGMYIRNMMLNANFYMLNNEDVFKFMLSSFVKMSVIFLTYSLASIIVESGLFNMYKSCVLGNGLEEGDFWNGVKKYFFKFLLINLLMIVGSIIILPIMIIFGIVTLFFGFILIPVIIIIVMIFITFWKISLVVNDSSIFSALKDSINLGKNFFFPLAFLQLIHWSFLGTVNTQSGASFSVNFSNVRNTPNTFDYNPASYLNIDFITKVIKVASAILIPVITIATLISSLIKMVFEVFFSLSLFVAYKHKFNTGDAQNKEVPHDVV